MSFPIQCACGTVLNVKPEFAGRKIRCSQCQQIIVVPHPPQRQRESAVHATLYQPAPTYRPAQRLPATSWKKKTGSNNMGVILGGFAFIGVLTIGLLVIVLSLTKKHDFGAEHAANDDAQAELQSARDAVAANQTDAATEAKRSSYLQQSLSGAKTARPVFGDSSATDVSNKGASSKPAKFDNLASSSNASPFTSNSSISSNSSSSSNEANSSDAATNAFSGSSSASVPRETMKLVDLIEMVEPSVVRIDVTGAEGESIGSGVYVDTNGLIVTNFHVVQGASSVQITNQDDQSCACPGFLYADPKKDLAVISIDPKALPLLPMRIARDLPRKGEEVAAFGAPMGFSFSATSGTVSSIRTGADIRSVFQNQAGIDIYSALGYSEQTNWIQMTASISGGNSGGPLSNMRGELIGINTFTNPAGQNLNFASTFEEVQMVIAEAKRLKVKSFYELPRHSIAIEFPATPSGREVASGDGGRPDQTPGHRGSGQNNPNPFSGGGTVVFEGPRVLTPEEREARNMSSTGTMEIVDPKEGQMFAADSEPEVVRSFSTGDSAIVDVSLSASEKYLAVTSLDGSVYVFDNTQQGKLLYQIESKYRLIRKAVFSNRPEQLITARDGGRDESVHIRDPETGKALNALEGHVSRKILALAASSDARSVFVKGDNILISNFWRINAIDDSVQNMLVVPRVPGFMGDLLSERCATFSPDNRILWIGAAEGWVASLSGAGAELNTTGAMRISNYSILDIAVLPDGDSLVTAGADGQARLVNVSNKKWKIHDLGSAINGELFGVCVSSHGKQAATTSADGKIRIYEIQGRNLKKTITLPTICASVKFFGKDQFVVAGCKDGKVRIYRVD